MFVARYWSHIQEFVSRRRIFIFLRFPKIVCWNASRFSWMFENNAYWFLGLLFLDFKVSWLLGFKVSWVQDVKDSMIAYYQISISCFQEILIPYSRFPYKQLDGSSWLFGAHLSPPKKLSRSRVGIYKNNISRKWFESLLELFWGFWSLQR